MVILRAYETLPCGGAATVHESTRHPHGEALAQRASNHEGSRRRSRPQARPASDPSRLRCAKRLRMRAVGCVGKHSSQALGRSEAKSREPALCPPGYSISRREPEDDDVPRCGFDDPGAIVARRDAACADGLAPAHAPHPPRSLQVTFFRRAVGWLASPRRRTGLRRAGLHKCRDSARPCAWTRRAGQDAATRRGRTSP